MEQQGRRAKDDAYDLALKALGYKERTESELRGWLAERGVEEAEIEEVIALLAEAGAIDDASGARPRGGAGGAGPRPPPPPLRRRQAPAGRVGAGPDRQGARGPRGDPRAH